MKRSALDQDLCALFRNAAAATAGNIGGNIAQLYPPHVAVTGFFQAGTEDVDTIADLLGSSLAVCGGGRAPTVSGGVVTTPDLVALRLTCPSGKAIAKAFKLAVAKAGLKVHGRYLAIRPKGVYNIVKQDGLRFFCLGVLEGPHPMVVASL